MMNNKLQKINMEKTRTRQRFPIIFFCVHSLLTNN